MEAVAVEGGEVAREEEVTMGEDAVHEGQGQEMVDAETVQGQENSGPKDDAAADGVDKAGEQKKGNELSNANTHS